MKVYCLAANFPPYHAGGYGQVAHAFCEGLQRRGHTVHVLTRQPHGEPVGPMPTMTVTRTLHTIEAGLTPWELFRRNTGNVRRVRKWLRDAPDVVFSCGSDGIGFSAYEAAVRSTPSLTYLGDTWLGQAWRSLPAYDAWADVASGGRRPGWQRLIKRTLGHGGTPFGLTRSNKPATLAPITVISQFVLDDLRAAGAPVTGNIPFTYVPLDPSFFHGSESIGHDGSRSPRLRALFVSRVEKLKGPDVAINAIAAAVKNGVDASLTIAGIQINTLRPALEAQVHSLGVAECVTFAGTPEKNELIKLYRSHDVFLFPSRIVEGLGLVNAEAQACGLPIIGTADSGAAEVIYHNQTGFRIAIDDHEAMARHLGELTDRTLWQRMSANALASAKRFHPDTILDTLEAALLAAVRA